MKKYNMSKNIWYEFKQLQSNNNKIALDILFSVNNTAKIKLDSFIGKIEFLFSPITEEIIYRSSKKRRADYFLDDLYRLSSNIEFEDRIDFCDIQEYRFCSICGLRLDSHTALFGILTKISCACCYCLDLIQNERLIGMCCFGHGDSLYEIERNTYRYQSNFCLICRDKNCGLRKFHIKKSVLMLLGKRNFPSSNFLLYPQIFQEYLTSGRINAFLVVWFILLLFLIKLYRKINRIPERYWKYFSGEGLSLKNLVKKILNNK